LTFLNKFVYYFQKQNFQKTEFTKRLEKINEELPMDNIKSESVVIEDKISNEYGINIKKKKIIIKILF